MPILGSRKSFIEDKLTKTKDYKIPAVFEHREKETSLKKYILFSAILHPTAIGLAALILFVLMLMGITFSLFDKPKPKINDITFVLVDDVKEQMPVNKKTAMRSKKNTRAGGITDKKKPVYTSSPSSTRKSVQQKQAPGPTTHKPVQKQPKKIIKPQNIFKSITQPKPAPEARPKPPTERPSIKPPSVPRPTLKQSSPFAVPIPKSSATPGRTYSTGPIGGHGTATSGGSSSNHGTSHYAPLPSLAPTGGGGSSSGSRLSKGGSGYTGNPGGGSGHSGVDSIRSVDYNAYIRYLERKIKLNWDAPKGNETKTTVVLFKIGRSGNLISRQIRKSSGIPGYDKAAINAVELAAPFKPFPADWRKTDIDVDFSFDYNFGK